MPAAIALCTPPPPPRHFSPCFVLLASHLLQYCSRAASASASCLLAQHKYRSLFPHSPFLPAQKASPCLGLCAALIFPLTPPASLSSSYARLLPVRKSQSIDTRVVDMAQTNGRQPSEAPSSSSSDLYAAHAAEPTKTQPSATHGANIPQKTAQAQPWPDLEDDGDSSSEMDVSDSSSSTASSDPESRPSHAGAKRKLGDTDPRDASVAPAAQQVVKKPRKSHPVVGHSPNPLMTAGWPPELWQQVFMHLSPAMLSRCLRVCRSFKFCLTQLKAPNVPRKRNAPVARVLDSEAIWTQARKHTYNTMPRPLLDFSELQMLQLLGGASCQSCGKPHVRSLVTNVFNAGPGESGVRIIWPFRARLCGKCFVDESLTVREYSIFVM